MISSFYTFRVLTASLAPRLSGRTLSSIFSQEKDELVIQPNGLEEALVVSCRRDEQTLFLHPNYTRARANVADIMPTIQGLRVLKVSMHPSDRIIALSLENDLTLYIQMFGPRSNVLLVDQHGTIQNAFRNGRTLEGQRIDHRSAEDLVDDPLRLLREALGTPSETLQEVLRKRFFRLGPTLIREVLHRSGVSGDTCLTEPLIAVVGDTITEILKEIESPQPQVYVSEDGIPAVFSIVELHHATDLLQKPYSDIHEALRTFVYRRRAMGSLEVDKRGLVEQLTRRVERARRALASIAAEPTASERSEEYERFGKLILSHLHKIPSGATEVELQDESGSYRIPLDPGIPFSKTAQRYFERAKRTRQSQNESARRTQQLEHRVRTGERLLVLLRTVVTREQLRKAMSDHREAFEHLGVGPKSKAREEIPFRVFVVNGGFEVWAGKNSTNNDLLTLRYARPNDLWFHARGSGGSHVVLRVSSATGQPSKKAKEQAAGIAAYYSKMRKAKHVPVAMTHRKYVRKRKGTPPGTVHIERERVIFATPGLPTTNQS
jgi:predicted ribosome quality control (RQC) complex YloA/Tae2 family protein